MGDVKRTALRVWKSAQLYIGFHRDRQGNQRAEAKVWPPKNGNATIHPNPDEAGGVSRGQGGGQGRAP